ncbi:MAG TPA: type II secretion system protein, partial [Phycisphaerae bacterium]|nr:type II secretion system protein [Phycisphaerae bacterium]
MTQMTSSKRAFTLVELLVVISIIGLLIAILVPTFSRARQQVRGVVCSSHLKQLMTGMHLYVTDEGVFPGTHGMFYFQNLFGAAWPRISGVTWDGARDRIVGLEVTPPYVKPYHLDPEFVDDVPGRGTLFPYLKDPDVYLCPSDKPGDATDTPRGGGGNGRLSYSLNAFVGYLAPERLGGFTYAADAPDNLLPDGTARSFTAGQHVNFAPAAFMTMFEEHPNVHINAGFPEGSFNGIDCIATRHMSATEANHPNPKGRATIAFLDDHVERPLYPARTEGRALFAEYGQPYFWRRSGAPDRANIARFIRQLSGPCPWG